MKADEAIKATRKAANLVCEGTADDEYRFVKGGEGVR